MELPAEVGAHQLWEHPVSPSSWETLSGIKVVCGTTQLCQMPLLEGLLRCYRM